MAFLDQEYDMSGTIFTSDSLESARSYLVGAIQKHDPTWLAKPTGYLSNYWRDNNLPAICYLIELSRILSTLDQNITKKSQVILAQKFKSLLREREGTNYEALITELQVACMLSERASPIALQPLVPEELLGKSNEPRSPDFAIRIPGGDVFIEVTVFHFGALDKLKSSANYFSNEISRPLLKMEKRRIIYLYLPITFRQTDLSKETISKICEAISSVSRGKKAFDASINIEWEPMPHIVTDSGRRGSFPDLQYATYGSAELGTMPAVAVEIRPLGKFPNEEVLKSLRNTLNTKRKQFPHKGPYFLIMKLGHHSLRVDGVISLINQRIWPNSAYGWVTGIAFFRPREQFFTTDKSPSLDFVFNPNPRHKPSEAFLALVEGKETYHL